MLIIIICPFRDRFLCFHTFKRLVRLAILGLKFKFKFSSSSLVMKMPRVSSGVFIRENPCGKGQDLGFLLCLALVLYIFGLKPFD